MLWKADAEIEDARKLPKWGEFHRVCGRSGLCFDIPSRDKNRGSFTVVAWQPRKTDAGGYDALELTRTTGKSLLTTLKRAHDGSGRATPESSALLDTMIKPDEPDPLEGMFG